MQSYKQFTKMLSEAPVADITPVGDFDRNSSFRKPVDRKLVGSDAGIERIKKAFRNTNEDFYFYFVNTPKANEHTEVGEVTLDWVKENLDEELYTKLAADMEESDGDGIFVVYTNNKGSEWRPMTPWILAHRFGHAVSRFSFNKGRSERQFRTYDELVNGVNSAAEELLGLGFGIDFDSRKFNRRAERREELLFKNFMQAHLTFKSARDKNLRDYFEVYNELIAQYLITGKTPIKTEPQPFKIGNSTVNPKRDEESLDDFRQMAEMYSRDIGDYYVNDIISSSVGKILVM